MNQQQRIEIHGSVAQMINSFMVQNKVSAAVMEDALNKVMVQLKDRVLEDMMLEAYQNAMEAMPQMEQDIAETESMIDEIVGEEEE